VGYRWKWGRVAIGGTGVGSPLSCQTRSQVFPRDDTGIHPALVAGVAQFQLVHIHPFVDGNGRTSRLLSTLCLYRSGYDFKRLFTLSEFYDRDRSRFYRALQSGREREMDLTAWLEFFVEGLTTQLTEVKERGEGHS
jgi:Fic family protein